MDPFEVKMGIPEMLTFWRTLTEKADSGTLNKKEEQLFKKLVKTINNLSYNPKHPGLKSHEIKPLTERYGEKVWQSYLENHKPAAGRLFWIYGPGEKCITIIGIEPHPNDKKDTYEKITLSSSSKTE